MLLHNRCRALMQHASAPIVSKARPGSEHFILGSRGKRVHSREAFEEHAIMFENGSHTRLLQHDLAQPYPIWIAIVAPRKVALMQLIPTQERATKGRQVLADCWRSGERRF